MLMTVRDRLAIVGLVTVTVHRAGRVVAVDRFTNRILDQGLDDLASCLGAGATVPEVTEVAWGLDDGTLLSLAGTNTALGSEDGFRPVLKFETTATAGERVTTAIFRSQDANVQIEELGWRTASGTLYARTFYSRLKDSQESLTIQRTDALTWTP